MDYSLRELECFMATAEELSFTRAARKLRLAQPPLSRHIRQLEEKLASPLFDRSNRRVSLTPSGAMFYEQTRTILPQLRQAGESTRRFASGQTSLLRIGFVSAVQSPELVGVLRKYRTLHPAVQLAVQDSSPSEQLDAIARGNLDGGFVGLQPREAAPGIKYLRWRHEPLAAFIPVGHGLASRKQLSLRELSGEAMVAVSAEAAPAFAAYLRERCADAGFRPRIVLESPRAQAVAVMVAAGVGIALLPSSLARIVDSAASVVLLKDVPPLTHVFACRAGKPAPAMKAFVDLLAPAEQ